MASLSRSLATITRRAVCAPSLRPVVAAVRCFAAAPPKKPAGKVATNVPAVQQPKKAAAPAVVEEMSDEETFNVPTVPEAKAALVTELKEELKENSGVVAEDESISQEYLQDLNGKIATDAATGDSTLSYQIGGYTVRVRFNKSQYEETDENNENFDDEGKSDGEAESEGGQIGRVPFEIDVDNGKTTIRFVAESQDNTCIIESMGFPDLAKEARAREIELSGKPLLPTEADFMNDLVQLEHMTDNAHDALQMFLESIKVNDELAQFVVHYCMHAQRLAHQRVIEQLSAFVSK